MPTLFRFLVRLRGDRRRDLWSDVWRSSPSSSRSARDVTIRIPSERLNPPRPARSKPMSDLGRAHVEAFLEMMSAERGAADNTLVSYERDLDDLSFLPARHAASG